MQTDVRPISLSNCFSCLLLFPLYLSKTLSPANLLYSYLHFVIPFPDDLTSTLPVSPKSLSSDSPISLFYCAIALCTRAIWRCGFHFLLPAYLLTPICLYSITNVPLKKLSTETTLLHVTNPVDTFLSSYVVSQWNLIYIVEGDGKVTFHLQIRANIKFYLRIWPLELDTFDLSLRSTTYELCKLEENGQFTVPWCPCLSNKVIISPIFWNFED